MPFLKGRDRRNSPFCISRLSKFSSGIFFISLAGNYLAVEPARSRALQNGCISPDVSYIRCTAVFIRPRSSSHSFSSVEQSLYELGPVCLVLARNGDLISTVLSEPCFIFSGGLVIVCHLMKPVDVWLMMNKVDTVA